MDARFRFYLILLVILLGLYAVAESQRPQEQRWDRTYQNTDKIPFGTYALVELLPGLFGTDDVRITREPVFNQLDNTYSYSSSSDSDASDSSNDTIDDKTEYSSIFIKDSVSWDSTVSSSARTTSPLNYIIVSPTVEIDSLTLYKLLHFADCGHHVFIATDNFPESLVNALGLVERPYTPAFTGRDSVRLLIAGDSTGRAYRFGSGDIGSSFRQKSPVANPAFTTLATDAAGRAVLVRARRGFGDITLCSVPAAFGNYFVLRPATAGFAWQALSTLPRGPVWWDEYTKQGRAGSDSVFRVLFQHPALKLSFWLLLGGGLLLLWIGGRRRQRIIPVVKPLPNNTLQFVRTVAGLYRQGDNHAPIAHRKIELFLDFLRTRYKEPTDNLAADAYRELLAQKSGLPRADINELLRRLNLIRTADYVSDGDLHWLSHALSEFRSR